MSERYSIDIPGVAVTPEPMGRGWQARVDGRPADWSRGATRDEAVGGLVRRLAVEHEGANWRREQASKAPRVQLSIVDLGGITSPEAYRLLGEEGVGAAHRREIRTIQKQAKAAGCECSWTYCGGGGAGLSFAPAPSPRRDGRGGVLMLHM